MPFKTALSKSDMIFKPHFSKIGFCSLPAVPFYGKKQHFFFVFEESAELICILKTNDYNCLDGIN